MRGRSLVAAATLLAVVGAIGVVGGDKGDGASAQTTAPTQPPASPPTTSPTATPQSAAPATPSAAPATDAAPGTSQSGVNAATPAAPSPQQRRPLRRLRADILAATTLPGVTRASWGIVIHSLDRDQRLFELNANHLLVPASLAKLVSAASAAEAVGWDYTFATTLRATGPIEGGVLRGDLLVVGSGDPSIGGQAGSDFSAWVAALTTLGITRIEGRIVGDDDSVEEPRPALAWAWDDLGYATGGIFGALNYGENRMAVTIRPGDAAGAPAGVAVEPYAAHRPLINRASTGATGTPRLVWAEQRPAEPGLTIAGSIPVGSAPARLLISAGNPTAWFVGVLRHQLVAGGIEVIGPAVDIDDAEPRPDRSTAALLYTHRSGSLAAIVQPMLKDSINLYAEAVMRLNAAAGVLPTNDAALEGLKQRFAAWGVIDDAQHQIDGSGLSRRNVIAPEVVLSVLERMQDASVASPFVTGLPVAGVDGSLAGRMQGTRAAGNVRAKTGTMSTVRSLAGYVSTADGERLAFAIIVNNFEGTGAQAIDAIDRIAVRLATFTRR